MSNPIVHEFSTQRLRLRQWLPADSDAFAAMNADPEVMKYFPSVLSRAQSDALLKRFKIQIESQGWGFWALELKASNELAGFVGLNRPEYNLPVSPCVEIGWRLAQPFWGNGYATEAASEALRFAFDNLGLTEVYAFTAEQNVRSELVMKRLGMRDTAVTFLHPLIEDGSELQRHILYKIESI